MIPVPIVVQIDREWAWLANPPVMLWSVGGGLTQVGALLRRDRRDVSEYDFEFKRISRAT